MGFHHYDAVYRSMKITKTYELTLICDIGIYSMITHKGQIFKQSECKYGRSSCGPYKFEID